jgi:hypothetical protein
MTSLFPPYLNAVSPDGTRSRGPAVVALQLFLVRCFLHTQEQLPVAISGVYDDNTVGYVKLLQEVLRLPPDEIDGNFGSTTRAAFKCQGGLDLEALFSGPTIWVDQDGTVKTWPPVEPLPAS